MAISTELLNSTFADFRGPIIHSFLQSIPLFRILEKKAKMRTNDGGTYIERSIGTGGAGRATGLFGGDEPLDLTRQKRVKKYQVEPHLLVVTASIPKKELSRNTGKNAVLRLIDDYPKSTMAAVAQDLNKYFLTGNSAGLVASSADLYGFQTFNGQFTSGIGTGVTNGLLDFAAVGSQTDSVQGVAKAEADFHYNQYGDITAFGTDGMKVLKKVYRNCAHFAEKPQGGPDCIIMDDDTFGNYELEKADLVRIQLSDNKSEGKMISNVLGYGEVYSDPTLALSLFSSPADDGVTYMLNTDFIEWILFESFEMGEFVDGNAEHHMVVAKAPLHGNLFVKKFPAQGCVSGGSA